MRKPIMAGNWKMNKTIPESIALAKAIHENVADYNNSAHPTHSNEIMKLWYYRVR